jgi:Transposase, Mutator family
VHFATSVLQVRAGAAANTWPVTWALGALGDGQPEVLGVWQPSIEGPPNWQGAYDDLAARGVKRIGFAVNTNVSAAYAAFPQMIVLNAAFSDSGAVEVSAGQAAPRSLAPRGDAYGQHGGSSELPSRVQRLAHQVEETAQLLQRGLKPAAMRRSPFESGGAAAAFLESWLDDAERRQRRRRLATSRRAYLGIAAVVR